MNLELIINNLKSNYFKNKKIIKVEPILKGYSFDKKVYLEDDKNNQYVLRVSDFSEYDKKQKEFEVMKQVEKLNVKMSKPLYIGVNEDEDVCFQLVSYLSGQDASETLSLYSEDEQYNIGFEAGIELKKMHKLVAPKNYPDWFLVKSKKNNRYINAYKELGIYIKGEEKIFNYMNENMDLMKNRPNHFQHDDFHVGNIIVEDKSYKGVIDFNRYDYGDPIHDFYKVPMFSTEISIPFSVGQIDGYFNHQVPKSFWELYTLYLSMSFIPSIVWSKKYYPEDLEEMTERVYRIYDEHKGFETIIPNWYK
ncbi:phosphotransferase [Mycoplasmatota bacterium]|nr:phosphotransferase [Mycoplasmatota bacterium]